MLHVQLNMPKKYHKFFIISKITQVSFKIQKAMLHHTVISRSNFNIFKNITLILSYIFLKITIIKENF